MASIKLPKLARALVSEYTLVRRFHFKRLLIPNRQSMTLMGTRTFASTSSSLRNDQSAEVKVDVPVKFTGSKAQYWKAEQSRSGRIRGDFPQYQPLVITISLSVFMIYFCILREENDIDKKFEKTLYDHVEGMEETQLKISLEYNRKNGLDTKDIEARLKEIREQ